MLVLVLGVVWVGVLGVLVSRFWCCREFLIVCMWCCWLVWMMFWILDFSGLWLSCCCVMLMKLLLVWFLFVRWKCLLVEVLMKLLICSWVRCVMFRGWFCRVFSWLRKCCVVFGDWL